MNRKSTNTDSTNDSTRCMHRTPSGRRCRMLVVGPGQLLCRRHADEFIKADGLNLREALLANSQGLQTAQGINLALGNIFKLLAANYISARRASVLTFICGQILRTLPAIDADSAAGITDPTAPKPTPPRVDPPAQPTAAIASLSPQSNPAPPRIAAPSIGAMPSAPQVATSESSLHLTVAPTKAAPPIAASQQDPVGHEQTP